MIQVRVRRTTTALAVVVGGSLLTACGSTPAVTYAPAAYGIPGQCYYIDQPAEATALLAAGLCPAGWVPTAMPLAWHEEYEDYYDSAAYYNTYVPVSYRSTYVSQQTTFVSTYKVQINSARSSATYKGSNGSTTSGSKAGALKFSSGSTSGSGSGSGVGSARNGGSGTTGGSNGGTSGGSKSGTSVSGKSGSSNSGTSRSGGSGVGSARSGRSH